MAAMSASDAPVLPLVDHVEGHAILVAAAGIQVLTLDVDVPHDALRDSIELDDGGVPNRLRDVLERAFHHGILSSDLTLNDAGLSWRAIL
jgi:hypothetical protein